MIRLVVLALLVAAHVARAAEPLPPPVAHALAEAGIPESAIGMVVQRVGDTQPLLDLNPDAALNPASTMKLVTTLAALDLLGPAWTWKTEALIDGRLEGDKLMGNLAIRGGGDPQLTIERLWLLVRRIRQAGVREIAGDVILDTTRFAAPADPGAFDGKPLRAYNVAPSALLLNYNAVNIKLAADEAGERLTATVEPEVSALRLVTRTRLDTGPCGDWKDRLQVKSEGPAEARRVTLEGHYARNCGEKNYPLSFFAAEDFFKSAFADLWRESGGLITGSFRMATTPADARLVARMESPPLSEVIRDMNKFSNNVMARQLFLTLGAEAGGPPGTPDNAREAMARWLAGRGFDFPEFAVENGSGLSRRERISARHLADLLAAAWTSPLAPELASSLPITAVDGTLKRRNGLGAAAGQGHLKTGTLDGVRSLAGYLMDRQGRHVVVVLIVNHPRAGNATLVEDALLAWAYDGAP